MFRDDIFIDNGFGFGRDEMIIDNGGCRKLLYSKSLGEMMSSLKMSMAWVWVWAGGWVWVEAPPSFNKEMDVIIGLCSVFGRN